MVTILPPKTNLGNYVGQAIGQGLGQGIQQGGQVGFQRNLVQNSLKDLENISPNTTPAQLASKLIQATAGIPGAERYVGMLYNTLLPTLQAQAKSSPEVEEALGALEKRSGVSDQKAVDFNTEVKQVLGEKFFPSVQPHAPTEGAESLKPLKPLVPPSPIGPAEESKIRRILNERGIKDPGVQDQQINQIKQYQKDLYAAQKEGFGNVQEYQKARQEKDAQFFNDIDIPLQEAHGTMTPQEKSIWKEFSRNFQDLPDPARFSNTEQMYNQLVGGPLISFEANQQGLPWASKFREGEIGNRLSNARTSVQDHIKRIEERKDIPDNIKGDVKNLLRDQYRNAMLSKDYGVAQAAYAVSNLSPEFASKLTKAPPVKETIADTVYFNNDPKMRDKFTYSLANALRNLKPEDSLLLAREQALRDNYDDQSFIQALNIAINAGSLKLSDFQANEKNQLSIPQRLDLDSIMERKRSVFDLFKGKK